MNTNDYDLVIGEADSNGIYKFFKLQDWNIAISNDVISNVCCAICESEYQVEDHLEVYFGEIINSVMMMPNSERDYEILGAAIAALAGCGFEAATLPPDWQGEPIKQPTEHTIH